MPARFRLSRRQSKELDRGNALRIALPAPVHEPDDLRRWVRDSLPDVPPTWLRAIDEREIVVRPVRGGADLETQIGAIVKDDFLPRLPEDALVFCVPVVVAEISQLPKPGSVYPIQWPGEWVRPEKEAVDTTIPPRAT